MAKFSSYQIVAADGWVAFEYKTKRAAQRWCVLYNEPAASVPLTGQSAHPGEYTVKRITDINDSVWDENGFDRDLHKV